MDLQKIIQERGLSEFPIGVVSNDSVSNYHVFVFDENSDSEKIIQHDNDFLILHHASLSETRPGKLLQYGKLRILQDPSWDLQMLLSKVREKQSLLYSDHAKNCLIESMFCCRKTIDAIDNSDVFVSCWQKCASYYLADAILSLNHQHSNSIFVLDTLRKLEKNLVNEHISIVTESIGIERATNTLLERMLKSTIGFSDLIEKNNHSQIIQKNHEYLINNSMLTDCYFYLGYVNKENFINIKNTLSRKQDLIHILKVAFDVESDSHLLLEYVDMIQKSCTAIIEILSRD